MEAKVKKRIKSEENTQTRKRCRDKFLVGKYTEYTCESFFLGGLRMLLLFFTNVFIYYMRSVYCFVESKGERETRRIFDVLKQDTKGDLKFLETVC